MFKAGIEINDSPNLGHHVMICFSYSKWAFKME